MISVLLVDDEPQLLELTGYFLERTKEFEVATAKSAGEAAELMKDSGFQAIVCDYQMPDMDGIDFLKALRARDIDIPFILFTGKGREDVAIEALNCGADFYLQKGGDPRSQFAELANMIKTSVAALTSKTQLAESERLFRLLAENSRDLVFRYALRPEPRFEYVSPSSTEIIGYTPEEHYANPRLGHEIVHPDDRHILDELTQLPEGSSKSTLLRWKRKDGEFIWIEQRLALIRDERGTLIALEGAARDVTERVMAERALRESGAFNRAVLDSLISSIAVLDAQGKILAVNRSWLEFASKNGAEMSRIGVGADYLGACDSAASQGDVTPSEVAVGIRAVLDGKVASFDREYPFDSPEGRKWFLLRVSPLPKRRGGAVVSHLDITERRNMEEALRAGEERYRAIFENTGSAMLIVEQDSTIALANSEFEKLTGYSKEEVEGRMKWSSFVLDEDIGRLTEYHEMRLKDPESAPRSYQFRARDRFDSEKSLLATAALVPGTRRTVISVIDETERRYYEEAAQQAGKKMDLLSRITRHDILNQLAVLQGYLDIAREKNEDGEVAGCVQKAAAASGSIKRHLEFARDYQNMGTRRPQWIDVRMACRRAESALELKGVSLVTEIRDLEVFSDPMLEKVFYNLIDNSLKHGRDTSLIRFRHTHGPYGLKLVYEDDGVGVRPEDKEAIFERSAVDTEGRRGYGLYLAREILSITGISITETGKHGKGVRFEMLVPKGKYRTAQRTDKKPVRKRTENR